MRRHLEMEGGRPSPRHDSHRSLRHIPEGKFFNHSEGPRPVELERLAIEKDLIPDEEAPSTPLSSVLFDGQRDPNQRRRIPRGGLSFTPDLPPARTISGSISLSKGREETIARAVSRAWAFGRDDRYGIRF